LGGVVAGLFGLYLHAAMRDFDRAYVAYYFLKPIVGLVLGPVMYLFARAGLMATQTDGGAIDRPELLYLGAFILGFGERFSLRLIDRVAAAIFGPTESAAASSASAPVPPPAESGPEPTAPSLPAQSQVRVRVPGLDDYSDVSATLAGTEGPVAVKGPPPDEGAEFVFVGLGPGAYEVHISKPGWRQTTPVTLELADPAATAEVEVALVPEAEPEGPGG
jgi:hypothetical protein